MCSLWYYESLAKSCLHQHSLKVGQHPECSCGKRQCHPLSVHSRDKTKATAVHGLCITLPNSHATTWLRNQCFLRVFPVGVNVSSCSRWTEALNITCERVLDLDPLFRHILFSYMCNDVRVIFNLTSP